MTFVGKDCKYMSSICCIALMCNKINTHIYQYLFFHTLSAGFFGLLSWLLSFVVKFPVTLQGTIAAHLTSSWHNAIPWRSVLHIWHGTGIPVSVICPYKQFTSTSPSHSRYTGVELGKSQHSTARYKYIVFADFQRWVHHRRFPSHRTFRRLKPLLPHLSLHISRKAATTALKMICLSRELVEVGACSG